MDDFVDFGDFGADNGGMVLCLHGVARYKWARPRIAAAAVVGVGLAV